MAQTNKICSICTKPGHSKYYCPTRPRATIKRTGKYFDMWERTRLKWLDLYGPHHPCHYCGRPLTADKLEFELGLTKRLLLTLDHVLSRSRHPSLRFILSNLVPACSGCNRRKGSLDHDEFVHTCHTDIPYIPPLF